MRNRSLLAIVFLVLPACASVGAPREALVGVSEARPEPVDSPEQVSGQGLATDPIDQVGCLIHTDECTCVTR